MFGHVKSDSKGGGVTKYLIAGKNYFTKEHSQEGIYSIVFMEISYTNILVLMVIRCFMNTLDNYFSGTLFPQFIPSGQLYRRQRIKHSREICMEKSPKISVIGFFVLSPLGHTGALSLYRSMTTTGVYVKHLCSRTPKSAHGGDLL